MSDLVAEQIIQVTARDRRQVIADLVTLTKPRVVVMILVTTLVGYYVALVGPADWARVLHLVFGTLLSAAGTLALNQYWERDVDARMERTRGRPLPEGRLQPLEALAFGAAITLGGVIYLAALSGIDPALHESAKIDGAGRLQRIRHVDLPGIMPTAVIILVLRGECSRRVLASDDWVPPHRLGPRATCGQTAPTFG